MTNNHCRFCYFSSTLCTSPTPFIRVMMTLFFFFSQANGWCSWAMTLGRTFFRRSSTARCPSLPSMSRTCTRWTTASSSTSTLPVRVHARTCAPSPISARASRLSLCPFSFILLLDSGQRRLGHPSCPFPRRGPLRSPVRSRPPGHGRQAHPDERRHQVRPQEFFSQHTLHLESIACLATLLL